jgi:hypothetical protein
MQDVLDMHKKILNIYIKNTKYNNGYVDILCINSSLKYIELHNCIRLDILKSIDSDSDTVDLDFSQYKMINFASDIWVNKDIGGKNTVVPHEILKIINHT